MSWSGGTRIFTSSEGKQPPNPQFIVAGPIREFHHSHPAMASNNSRLQNPSMNRTDFLVPFFLIATAIGANASPARSLLDESLSQWEIFMGVPHESVVVPGFPPATSKDGTTGTPLGLGKDPLKVFTVEIVDGKPVLRISGQIYAGLTTLEEFENFHFSCQFKWGEKKWEPRLDQKRDSGILYHCVGPHGAFWNVWMRCIEFQVQEGDCGDFITLAGTTGDVRLSTIADSDEFRFDPDGSLYSAVGYARHAPSAESPHGEWNTLEILTLAGTAVHLVNGKPVMVVFDTRQNAPEGRGHVPLKRGKIQIQSEAAEVFYRNMEIRTINTFPETLASLVRKPTTQPVPFPR